MKGIMRLYVLSQEWSSTVLFSIYLFVSTAMNDSAVVVDADNNVYAKECYERKWTRFKLIFPQNDRNCGLNLRRAFTLYALHWLSISFSTN